MSMKDKLAYVLRSTGRIGPKDRVEIVEIVETISGGGDYARVGLYAYHGRRKQPYVYWNLCIDMARELVHWDTSTFYYL